MGARRREPAWWCLGVGLRAGGRRLGSAGAGAGAGAAVGLQQPIFAGVCVSAHGEVGG